MDVLVSWRANVTLYFTWLFIGSRVVFLFLLVFILIKFGHVKMGSEHEKPEFTTGESFSMIFAAGVAVGLFVFGASEPMWHQG